MAGMGGIDPSVMLALAKGLRAQSELQGLNSGPEMRMALEQASSPYEQVQGEGFASQAPGVLNLIANIAERRQGQGRVNALDERAKVLRGEVTEGSLAEKQQALQLAQQEALAKQQAQVVQHENNMIRDRAKLEGQAQLRTETTKPARIRYKDLVGPDGKTVRVGESDTGDVFLNGERIDPSAYREVDKSIRGGTELKPSASQMNEYMAADKSLATLDELTKYYGDAPDAVKDDADSSLKSAFVDYTPTQPLTRMMENTLYRHPETKDYLARIYQFDSRLTKEMTGLSGSKYEMKDRQRWSPGAPGIDQPERERRIAAIKDDLGKRKETLEINYPTYIGARRGKGLSDRDSSIAPLTEREKALPKTLLDEAKKMAREQTPARAEKNIDEMTEAEIDAELRGE
jgi:hypothetical protein